MGGKVRLGGGAAGIVSAGLICLAVASASPAAAQSRSYSWDYNSFGVPGLIDMPSALSRPDGELGLGVSSFADQTRTSLTFQISDRLSASFRYSFLYDLRSRPNPTGKIFPYIFDRSFSLHYRFLDEGRYRPAMAIGINDLLGTGIYGGEYVVATKTVTPQVRVSAGIGWGRLGTVNGFANPLAVISDGFRVRPTDRGPQGGTFEPDQWFRGNAALFGGIEWQATDRLRFVAEYSSDDYARESPTAFQRKSPLNFGVSYRYSDRTTLSARYLYGSEIGLQLTYALNPKQPRFGSGLDPAPPPILRRGAGAGLPEGSNLSRSLAAALAREGLALEGLDRQGQTLRAQIRNERYASEAQATGRAARILARLAPEDVGVFDIRLAANSMPVTSVVLRRSDLEDLEFHPVAPDLSRAAARIVDIRDRLPVVEGRYPVLSYGLEPYVLPSLFDPDAPLRLDLGVALYGRYEPRPGLIFSGRIHQKIAGNLNDTNRPSTSVLPRVRSEAYLYYKEGSTTIPELTAAWYMRPGKDLFARVTFGYLEPMFGGVSAELLWKPQNSRLALGAEVNYVQQRDFNQLFGFRDYKVATGHLSAYYDLGRGYTAQIDVGRYLAGDVGATVSLSREFNNGWKIGAFATKTNVSAAQFGEGSFDKGIRLTIPLDWVSGRPSRTRLSSDIRPVQRDGGARLGVSGRLYDTVREKQATRLDATWGRFWR